MNYFDCRPLVCRGIYKCLRIKTMVEVKGDNGARASHRLFGVKLEEEPGTCLFQPLSKDQDRDRSNW